jgi:hypothetical protein
LFLESPALRTNNKIKEYVPSKTAKAGIRVRGGKIDAIDGGAATCAETKPLIGISSKTESILAERTQFSPDVLRLSL